jgi:hypothetical protein
MLAHGSHAFCAAFRDTEEGALQHYPPHKLNGQAAFSVMCSCFSLKKLAPVQREVGRRNELGRTSKIMHWQVEVLFLHLMTPLNTHFACFYPVAFCSPQSFKRHAHENTALLPKEPLLPSPAHSEVAT